jgi:dihydrofolate reductase
MRKLAMFNTISLDGFFTGPDNDMSFAHEGGNDPESQTFTENNAGGQGALVFGRVTYEMMAAFWPTPAAQQMLPKVAEGMNRMEKIVFSHSLKNPGWNNSRVVSGDTAEVMRTLKAGEGPDMVILGSGKIVAPLADAGLIDEYQFMIQPAVLGAGRTLFEGLTQRPKLRLVESRSFKSGKLFVRYTAI